MAYVYVKKTTVLEILKGLEISARSREVQMALRHAMLQVGEIRGKVRRELGDYNSINKNNAKIS